MAGFSVDNEEGIFCASNGSAATMANVVVEDVSEGGGSRYRGFVSVFLVHCGSFAARFDGISADVANGDGVGND